MLENAYKLVCVRTCYIAVYVVVKEILIHPWGFQPHLGVRTVHVCVTHVHVYGEIYYNSINDICCPLHVGVTVMNAVFSFSCVKL